jgi:hypothetical protein
MTNITSTQILLIFSIVFLSFVYTTQTLIQYENRIDKLEFEIQHSNDSLTTIIDSLKKEIDTLVYEKEIWDYNISNNTTDLLSALIMVESSNYDSAYNASEDAVGCLQIRKTMVNDINRILKRQGQELRFTYNDRWCRNKSIKMFEIYCNYYGLTTAEEIARCWNGGPRGINKKATVGYWDKVQEEMNS